MNNTSVWEKIKQFLIDIPKILWGLYTLSIGLGGLMLFYYFILINYLPVFDLAALAWMLVFIAVTGLLILLLMGGIFIFPGWWLNSILHAIKERKEKAKWLYFFTPNNYEGLSIYSNRLVLFFVTPWIINFLLLLIVEFAYPYRGLLISKVKHTAPFFISQVVAYVANNMLFLLFPAPLIIVPVIWKLWILPSDEKKYFKLINLFLIGFIFCCSFWASTFLAVPLSLNTQVQINDKLFSVVYLIFIYIVVGYATWSISCSKDKQKLFKIILSCVILLPMISFILADKVDVMINSPMRIFNLGKVPIELQINPRYFEVLQKKVAGYNIVFNDETIKGTLLSRLGSEYIVQISCKTCHEDKNNLIIPIPKEKIEGPPIFQSM